MSILNKQSLKVDNVVTTECRSCLDLKNESDMRGKLCTWCLSNAGRSIHNKEFEDIYLYKICKDGRTQPRRNTY